MDKFVSLEQLKTERARLAEAREQLKLNLVAHDGALQQLDQLILMAERPGKKAPSVAIDINSEDEQRDTPAEEQPGASQKA